MLSMSSDILETDTKLLWIAARLVYRYKNGSEVYHHILYIYVYLWSPTFIYTLNFRKVLFPIFVAYC